MILLGNRSAFILFLAVSSLVLWAQVSSAQVPKKIDRPASDPTPKPTPLLSTSPASPKTTSEKKVPVKSASSEKKRPQPKAALAQQNWKDFDLAKLPLPQVSWSDAKLAKGLKTVSRWVLDEKQAEKSSPLKNSSRLYLKTWIEFPDGMTYEFKGGSDGKPGKIPTGWERDPKTLPFKRASIWSQVAAFEMGLQHERSFELLLTPAGGSPQAVTLSSKVALAGDLFLMHESCKSQAIFPRQITTKNQSAASRGQVFLLYCVKADSVGGVYLLTELGPSPDFVWGKKPSPKKGQTMFLSVSSDDLETEIAKRIGNLQWKGPQSGQEVFHTIWISPENQSKRWGISVGISGTYISYSETNRPTLTEGGITPKVTAVFRVIPGVLDIGANSFFTLIPFAHQPTRLNPARFLGINGRVGYRLPINFANISWSVSLGYYFWTMIVPSNQYGMQYLSGPQLFLTGFVPFARGMGAFWYLKYAVIADRFMVSFVTNREFAVGGGFQFSNKWKKAWSVTTDLATSAFSQDSSRSNPKGFSMFNASLGFQVGF